MNNAALRQFILYAICGGSSVALDLGIYSTLVWLGTWYQLANIVGYAMGTLLSFALNRAFTFKVYDRAWLRLAIFFSVALTGYLASTALLWWLVDILSLHAILAKFLTLFVVLILQFSLNRVFTFKTIQTQS